MMWALPRETEVAATGEDNFYLVVLEIANWGPYGTSQMKISIPVRSPSNMKASLSSGTLHRSQQRNEKPVHLLLFGIKENV